MEIVRVMEKMRRKGKGLENFEGEWGRSDRNGED